MADANKGETGKKEISKKDKQLDESELKEDDIGSVCGKDYNDDGDALDQGVGCWADS